MRVAGDKGKVEGARVEARVSLAKRSIVPVFVSWGIALVALLSAALGVFWRGAAGPTEFVSVRGESVELFGWGLYRFDALLSGAGARGTDLVTLILVVPLLVLASLALRRGSLRGGLVFLGALTWFLYVYGSYSLGTVAYNELFLVYVALFSASLFSFVATFRELEPRLAPVLDRLPLRGPAVFLVVSGVATLVIWLLDPVMALFEGEPPAALASYTTLFTYAVDLGVIAPAAVLAAVAMRRRRAVGYVTAVALLSLEALLAPMIAAQTVSQLAAGVEFSLVEALGPIGGFVVLSLVSVWFLLDILRAVPAVGENTARNFTSLG